MTIPALLQARDGGVSVTVKVQPRASRNEIGDATGAELKIRVTAPPVDSAANEAVLRLLAEALELPRGAVQLVHGGTTRRKMLFVRGVTPEEFLRRLARK
jgi:uncharacterized protein (TIGR00251 family)